MTCTCDDPHKPVGMPCPPESEAIDLSSFGLCEDAGSALVFSVLKEEQSMRLILITLVLIAVPALASAKVRMPGGKRLPVKPIPDPDVRPDSEGRVPPHLVFVAYKGIKLSNCRRNLRRWSSWKRLSSSCPPTPGQPRAARVATAMYCW